MTAPQMIFVNLPVTDLARARAFYEGIGFTINPQFSDETAACVVVSETIYLMILTAAKFESFCPRPMGDPAKTCSVLTCLSRDSRAAVDAMTEAAVAAGGTDNHKPQDYGFMYGRSFSDPDGNVFEVVWMDLAAAEAAQPSATGA